MKIKQTILLFTLFFTGSLMAQTVSHFAGIQNDVDPETHINNDTCSRSTVYFFNPEGITWDKNGYMWITERNKIRIFYNNKFYNRSGLLGDGSTTAGYKNASSTLSAFNNPTSIVSDPTSGILYIADAGNHAIRSLDAFGSIGSAQTAKTYAGAASSGSAPGAGTPGYDDKTGSAARFNFPQGIARDSKGNFYVTDNGNSVIRKITSATASTVAGTSGVMGGKDGKTGVALFAFPYGIAMMGDDTLIVSDQSAGTIRLIHLSSFDVSTIGGAENQLASIDGTIAVSRFKSPKGVAVVGRKIFVCDGSKIRLIDLYAGTVSTFAGSDTEGNKDGIGAAAQFGSLAGIAYNATSKLLYVTDLVYNVIKTVNIAVANPPTVTFTASKTSNVVINEVVTLTNTSTGKPATSLKWTITPGTYTISSGSLTSSPLDLKFTANDKYTVKLEITNPDGTNSSTKTNFISVGSIGIQHVSKNSSLTVAPNPSAGIFTVQSPEGNSPIQSFEVSDITGKVLLSKTCSNSLSETFDIGNVKAGFYFLTVNTSSGSNTLKLQKN